MGWLGEILIIGVIALIVAPVVGLWVRRRWLSGRGGVFDCGLREDLDKPGWMLGMALYGDDALEWYRVFSVSLRPRLVLRRSQVELLRRRLPDQVESVALFDASEVVALRVVAGEVRTVELAMSTESVMGLASWIEAGPRAGSAYPGGE